MGISALRMRGYDKRIDDYDTRKGLPAPACPKKRHLLRATKGFDAELMVTTVTIIFYTSLSRRSVSHSFPQASMLQST